MNNFIAEQQEWIALTAERLGLENLFVVEKDYYVTQAIEALMAVEDETFKLVFQGGTALAKAHQLVNRMSEDCDFRVTYRDSSHARKKDAQRRLLRNFRRKLLVALQDAGFEISQESVRVRNEGQFIAVRACYPSLHDVPMGLKPHLALEFFLGTIERCNYSWGGLNYT